MTTINTASTADIAQFPNTDEPAPEKIAAFFEALHHGGQLLVSQLLIAYPVLVNAVDPVQDKSAFEIALAGGLSKVAQLLLDCEEFDVNHQGHHALRMAIELGYLGLAAQLLAKGSNPNYRPEHISSALLLCLEREYFELAELMVQHGAEVDIRNDKGWTPLIWAAIKGRKTAVEFLLRHGANIHLCNNDGWNAITGAYFKNRTDIVEMLKQQGAVFGARFGEAALISAYQDGNLALVNELLDSGVSANLSDEKGESLLAKAMGRGDRALVIRLLELGADPNARDTVSMPLLVVAATNGDLELVRTFITAGASVNLSSGKGRTALWRAVVYNYIEVVKLLLGHGANANVEFEGESVLYGAASKGYLQVVIALVNAGANIELSKGSYTPYSISEFRYQKAKSGSQTEATYEAIMDWVKPRGMTADG